MTIVNDEYNIAQRKKLANSMDISEEKAAEFMTMMHMYQEKALKDIMERVTYQANKMICGMVASGIPINMARTLSQGMAMSAALSIIENVSIKKESEQSSKLAKDILALVEKSGAVTVKIEEENKVEL